MSELKKLLVIVDFQKDFVYKWGALPVPGAEKLVPLLDNFFIHDVYDGKYDAILETFDTHNEVDYPLSPESKMFPIHCVPGTRGFEFADSKGGWDHGSIEDVLNYLNEKVITAYKNQFDLWQGASLVKRRNGMNVPLSLNQFLTNHPAHEYEIEIVGIASDYCVKDNIKGWLDRGYKVTVFRNLTAGIERTIDEVREQEGWDFDIVDYETSV